MFLSDAAVRRPVAMSCLLIGLSLLGFNAYRTMGLELFPKADIPFVTVITVYPGASPKEIETDIAKRIEDQVVSIDGLKHVTSICMENVCQTMLEFNLDVNVDIAAMDVREKLDLIKADFPEDVEDPKVVKFDLGATPIIKLALTGDVPVAELYDFADNVLRDRISVLSGVADVTLVGGAAREVRVQLDRQALGARGLTAADVVGALRNNVRTIPAGRLRDTGVEISVKFDADYEKLEDIAGLEIDNRDGRRCYLRDVGVVRMSTEEVREKAFIDGRPCVSVEVIKKADANAVAVVNRVRAAMDDLNKELPGGMELVWHTDDGTYISATVNSAWLNVAQGIALTALILFIFLYNLRSLLLVSITMPLTIIIGLFFMQFLGYTLNMSTLLAIGMSVGILVTNAIVVLESIVKRLDETGDPKKAAKLGSGEAAIAVIASAGTNVVVLFPIAMMGSLVGLFMRPFSVTMLIMTVVSLFVSFTLTPLLASLLLRPRDAQQRGLLVWMERLWNRGFERVVRGYSRVLRFVERHRSVAALILLGVFIIFVHSLTLAAKVGSSFFEESDRGELLVKLEFPTQYALDRTEKRVREIESRFSDMPEMRHRLVTVGGVSGQMGQSSEGVYLSQMLLKFSERTERELTIDDLAQEARQRLVGIPDCIVSVSIPSAVGGQAIPIQLEIAGADLEMLDRLALNMRDFALEAGGYVDPDTTVRAGKPELRVSPNRPLLSDLAMPATAIGINMRANLEGLDAGTYKRDARNYDIVVELEEREGARQVEEFLFPDEDGHPLLLAGLGTLEETVAPIQIVRKDKRRVSKLFSRLETDKPLGMAVTELREYTETGADLPPGYDIKFTGDVEYMEEAQAEMGEAALIAIVLVVLTLAAILESFRQPVVILVTLPLAVIGVFWALYLSGNSLSMFALMGSVMLIGIVVNNAILIMDRLNVHIREGMPRHQAMLQAAADRFRPIVMITLAAVLGMMPMAIGRGIGAEMRNAVGIASVGGIAVSGVLTLIVLPILYDFFTRKAAKK
jgi:hydrophobic/amphiphilic exporter-1 (mainly G- bacteria), HAE1 family